MGDSTIEPPISFPNQESKTRPPQLLPPAQVFSAVSFPSSAQPEVAPLPPRPILPFRRISASSDAFYRKRNSIASVMSVESVPEEIGGAQPGPSSSGTATPSAADQPRRPRPTSAQFGPSRPRMRLDSRHRNSRNDVISLAEKDDKRRRILTELLDTEKSYSTGLDLIYDLFLVPLMDSLETPTPILGRKDLNTIFMNFVDIWNFHRTFLVALSERLSEDANPSIATLLAEHFPYLALYRPFVSAYGESINALLSLPESNPAFRDFLKTQQADLRCGKLTLRDWLLSIIQRCPRYLLLLKDLMSCTEPSSDEYEGLTAVHALVSRTTEALNTSLALHQQTIALLALQKSTPNLPFPLVSPGRTLIRRAKLLKVDKEQRLREFILLSDSILWLSSTAEKEWEVALNNITNVKSRGLPIRPGMGPRARSKSEAELPTWRTNSGLSDTAARDTKWSYHGHFGLLDVEVVVPTLASPGEGRRLDLFGPTESFAVYASTERERDSWVEAIRTTKSSLLMNPNVAQQDSTLTSSSSTTHLRRALQALPYAPNSPEQQRSPRTPVRRRKVDHFVPPIWVPDGKATLCMRCKKPFGLLKRRHHCRLCGKVVCASCSERTFFISDASDPQPPKPARACNACYENVFPPLPSGNVPSSSPPAAASILRPARPSTMYVPTLPDIPSQKTLGSDTGTSLPDEVPVLLSSSPTFLPTTSVSLPASPRNDQDGSGFTSPLGSRLSTGTADTTLSEPIQYPYNRESMRRFTLPIPVPSTDSKASSELSEDAKFRREYLPWVADGGDAPSRGHSRSSVVGLPDFFYNGGNRNLGSNSDLPADLLEELERRTASRDNGDDEASIQPPSTPRKRVSFVASSAIHKAPVTIYPAPRSDDDSQRLSLVLSGKGTIGRGAGLDIGNPVGETKEVVVARETTPNGSKNGGEKFAGLEKGAAAGKLSWLLKRERKKVKTPSQ